MGRSFGLFVLILISLSGVAVAGEPSPRFTASTLRGQTFTNDSLKGRVTLLEFWTTWCPSCKSDQSVLDEISREFSGQGLVSLRWTRMSQVIRSRNIFRSTRGHATLC